MPVGGACAGTKATAIVSLGACLPIGGAWVRTLASVVAGISNPPPWPWWLGRRGGPAVASVAAGGVLRGALVDVASVAARG